MRRILLGLLFLSSYSLRAQTSSVTALVQDPNGQTFNNGTCLVQFVPTPNTPGPFLLNGSSFNQQPACTIDGGGNMAVTVSRNDNILPAKSQWNFIVCPNADTKCTSVSTGINAASVDLSAFINSNISAIGVFAGKMPRAYVDSEAILTPNTGGMYFRVTDNLLRVWNGTTWITIGAGTVPGNPNTSIQFNCSGNFCGDANLTFTDGVGGPDFAISNSSNVYFEIATGFVAGQTPSVIESLVPGITYTGNFSSTTGISTNFRTGSDGAAAANSQGIVNNEATCGSTNGSACITYDSIINTTADAGQNTFGTKQAIAFNATVDSTENNGNSTGFSATVTCEGTPCTAHAFVDAGGDFLLNSIAGVSGQPLISQGVNAIPAWGTVTGSGAFVKQTAPTIITPKINTDVDCTGTGLQCVTGTTCTTAAAANAACATTVTWPTTWANTTYLAFCQLKDQVSGGAAVITGSGTRTTTTLVLEIQNLGTNAAATQYTYDCFGMEKH